MKTRINNLIIKLLATGFGLGYCPIASGTVGSLLGVAIFFFLASLKLLSIYYVIICICLFFFGVLISDIAEKLFNKKDSSEIVIDEIVGCIIVLLFIPISIWCIIYAFILFRILDIIKPFPANRSQKLSGGWGIMMDDLICSFYTIFIVHITLWLKGLMIKCV